MSEQSQEWTPEGGTLITPNEIFKIGKYRAKSIADAHNAALAALEAAERDRNFAAEKELRDKARMRIEELKQQLAAERERRKPLVEALERLRGRIKEAHGLPNFGSMEIAEIDNALAKAKEGK